MMTLRLVNHIIIVGGGLSGLATATYLARAGKTVTLFEKRRHLGGRAVTHLRHGYRFNLGPHAVYRAGAGYSVYRELGVPVRGGMPPSRGIALFHSAEFALPASPFSTIATSLLRPSARLEAIRFFWRLRRRSRTSIDDVSVREWLDRSIEDDRLRQTIEAFVRLSTYTNDPAEMSARMAFHQLKIAMKGVIYVDEGWQKLVDALHSHAVAAGVNFVTSSRVVGVDHDGTRVRGLEIGGLELDDVGSDTLGLTLPEPSLVDDRGTKIPADVVVLAIDPTSARELITRDGHDAVAADWPAMHPIQVSCFDVALSALPQPSRTFALGIDLPLYYSVHSAYAQLTPRGGALLHVAKYSAHAGQSELEQLLDQMQPGWREKVVHTRFLPAMTVSNALPRAGERHPSPVTPVHGLYVAGDWVGDEGMLSDAALSSARAVARAILGNHS